METYQRYMVQLLRTVKVAVIRRDLMALTVACGTVRETRGVIFCHGSMHQLAGQIQAFRFQQCLAKFRYKSMRSD